MRGKYIPLLQSVSIMLFAVLGCGNNCKKACSFDCKMKKRSNQKQCIKICTLRLESKGITEKQCNARLVLQKMVLKRKIKAEKEVAKPPGCIKSVLPKGGKHLRAAWILGKT